MIYDSVIETSTFSISNRIGRVAWFFGYRLLFRPFVPNIFRTWRCTVLRLFGAEIGHNSNVAASVKIWAPWNLVLGNFSCLAPKIDLYNQGKIIIGDNCIISQKTYLCASTHNFELFSFPLIQKPIYIKNRVWVAADAFIGPGAEIGEGAVVGARAAVFGIVKAWTVVGGNPAKLIKIRKMET